MLPNFPIVDAHVHLWDPSQIRYPWLETNPSLNRPFLLDDFRKACGPVQADKMVFLQCECDPAQYEQEAQWVTSLAQKDSRLQGIVPWAPLEKGDGVIPELERLAQNKLIKGVRRIIQFESDLDFCLRPDFIRGVQALEAFQFSFDICIAPIHLGNTIQMVRKCPEISFILDHVGKPNIKDGEVKSWKRQLEELADCPNVHCKLSGMATEADHLNWTREQLKPYIDHVVTCFGFDRLVFGGDWPVSTQAIRYTEWIQTLMWALSGTSLADLKNLFRENAIRFYRLSQD